MHAVAVGQRAVERLEQDGHPALAAHIPVGTGVEGEAAAVGGQRAEPGAACPAVGGQDQVHPADQGQIRLAPAQALARQVHRHQRRRLRRVDGQARPGQAEHVGEPVGEDAAVEAGHRVPAGLDAAQVVEGGVVVPEGGGEDGGPAPGERGGHDAGLLQGLPAQFEQEPLLRVHRRRLLRRDAEEGGVEAVDLVEVGPARLAEAAPGGGGADRVAPFGQQPPEGVGVRRARQPAGQADDGDGGAGVGVGHTTQLGLNR